MKRKHPFTVGNIYHVYNRGVAKCAICLEEADYWRFLQGLCLFNDKKSATNILWQLERNRSKLTLGVLKNYLIDQGNERVRLIRILAYCLMDNHYHLLVEEIQEGGITKFMHKLGLGYAKYFNNKHERVGSLFQDKFKNVPVEDDAYLQYLLVYINVLNPAEFVAPHWKEERIRDIKVVLRYAEQYPRSTHQEYLGKRNSLIIEKGIFEKLLLTPESYYSLVEDTLRGKKYQVIGNLTLE